MRDDFRGTESRVRTGTTDVEPGDIVISDDAAPIMCCPRCARLWPMMGYDITVEDGKPTVGSRVNCILCYAGFEVQNGVIV